tara:strand:+ start:303 stop:884 length:582 start_codon:yes stop_codon:yes gene_type:complete
MKNFLLLIILMTCLNLSSQVQMDLSKSSIKWIGKEITTKEHFGALKFSKAQLEFNGDELTGGEFTVDMTTLDVQDLSGGGKQRLEGHLRSDDFFSVDKHKSSFLKINEVLSPELSRIASDNNSFEVNGELTIKGITQPIVFTLKPLSDQKYIADLTFDRSDYNVKFRSGSFFENLGDKLILDDIKLEVTLVKK